jgi:hypothetical protein
VRCQQQAPPTLYPRGRLGTQFTGDWVGPSAGLDGRKSRPQPGFNPGPSSRTQSLYRLSYPAHPPIAVRYLNVRIGITETLTYKDISCTSYLLFPRRCFQIGFSLGICFLQLCQSTRPSAILKIKRHHQPGSTRWRSWLRHCATTLKVAGSIPDVVTGIFH